MSINTPFGKTLIIDKVGHYLKFMSKIQLLTSAGKIDFKEAGRLLSMMDSKDPENWTVAEECINQKISEL